MRVTDDGLRVKLLAASALYIYTYIYILYRKLEGARASCHRRALGEARARHVADVTDDVPSCIFVSLRILFFYTLFVVSLNLLSFVRTVNVRVQLLQCRLYFRREAIEIGVTLRTFRHWEPPGSWTANCIQDVTTVRASEAGRRDGIDKTENID